MSAEQKTGTIIEADTEWSASTQPYTPDEIAKLDRILDMVRRGSTSEQMGHWGNHTDYSKGW